ncbi:signal peptidase I [Streptomyces sp. Rer75]|uniref:signal peptidase I n=1 Tax=unclassified Streptomyces TaxID=2593676 RepID=UPI00211EB57F|nr:signal peptidase I [Streptomyces sp. Rer75]
MGDLAVGARSGHEEPERRPGTRGEGTADQAPEASGASPAPGGAPTAESADTPPSGPSGPTGPPPPGPGAGAERETGSEEESKQPGAGRRPAKGRKVRSFWKELPILIFIALVLALLIKTFLVQAFSIPSDSMQNTLQRGDRVLVDKLTPWFGSKPERGEVVVFHDPGGWLGETQTQDSGPIAEGIQEALSRVGLMPSADEKDLIKRVIAVGGDTVSCKRGGNVMVNGKALDEPYIFPGNTPCDEKPFGPVKVPKDRIWVMGDHRQDSLDSRYHQNLHNGTVSVDDVVGRAIVVAWPVNRWSALSIPGTFDQPGLSAAASMAPSALGLAGAVPIVLWRRRRREAKVRGTAD